jgi:nucleolar protein 56
MMIVTKWFGTFLCEGGSVQKEVLFPMDAKEIASRLQKFEEGAILDEEREIVKDLDEFSVSEERLVKLGGKLEDGEFSDIEPGKFNISQDLLHDAMMLLAQDKMKKAVTPETHIVQAINAVDDLIHTSNVLSERLREWYGHHNPEVEKHVLDENLAGMILQTMKEEEETPTEDRTAMIDLAESIESLNGTRKILEEGINKQMDIHAKNVAYLAGPLIGARLISRAGSLERLSFLPSGTIQILGAEKALFRHLKEGAKPPKHGVIFQHPFVHQAPYWQRGRIARAFAAKLAIAAKMDHNSDTFVGDDLKNILISRIEEIRKKYPIPPKRRKRKR